MLFSVKTPMHLKTLLLQLETHGQDQMKSYLLLVVILTTPFDPPSYLLLGSGVPLNLKNGKYISSQFFILNSMDEIPYIYDPIPIIKPRFTTE